MWRTTTLWCGFLSILCVLIGDVDVRAIQNRTCTGYEIIYARGSGQVVNALPGQSGYEVEREALRNRLTQNLTPGTYSFIELDNEQMQVSGEYRAVKVDEDQTKVGAQATISQGIFGKYKESVEDGVELLNNYISTRNLEDTNQCFILTGYSQGAQVVGDFLKKYREKPYVDSVEYVGLMGDPKHNSTGYLKFGSLPGSILPWYRGDSWILFHDGWLGARVFEYLPRKDDDTLMKAGSWCYKDDPICSGYIFNGFAAHGKYSERAIPHMALEIASVINNPTGTVTKSLYPKETCGPAKQDIVVLLDTSPLMRRDAMLFTDTSMYYGNDTGQRQPTAGEMLARTGCGDTRIAVMGYGRAQDGPPRLLLDFTKDPKAYDALMKSLYEPNASGHYERTQFREGALAAMDVNWRQDAGRAILTITDVAGSGSVGNDGWRGWADQRVSQPYMKSNLSQQVVTKSREKDVIILGVPVQHSFAGFTLGSPDNADTSSAIYLRMMASATGGYMWVRELPSYQGYNFKHTLLDETLNHPLRMREKTVATIASARGKVGEPLTLKVADPLSYLAATALRSEPKSFTWYVDCNDKTQILYDIRQEITFIPAKAQKCKARVVVSVQRNTGAGCYYGCPEPFPPYLYRSIAFDIDIKPAGYTPKIPAKITDIEKIIHDDKVTYTWEEPSYTGVGNIVYIVRDSEGSVLAATTARQLTITETEGRDPEVAIESSGEDGKSEAVAGASAVTTDLRTPPMEPVADEEAEQMIDPQPQTAVDVASAPTISAALSVQPAREDVVELDSVAPVLAVLGMEAPTATQPLSVEGAPSIAQSALTEQQGSNTIPWWGIITLIPALIITVLVIRKLEIK